MESSPLLKPHINQVCKFAFPPRYHKGALPTAGRLVDSTGERLKTMADVEKTLALVKPDAVRKGKATEIMQLIELNGFTIIAKQKMQVRPWDACSCIK